ncbi:MAG TPA: HNH endonuclease signature motif containing protein [Thermoanaerobaculia bacterium]|nr:HNH endonuclease signature motif containing protein [Thermoanaerobaculia bacterium]
MAQHVSARLRRLVVRRARNRCEYCGLSQLGQEATFHVDHVVPVIAGGHDTGDNLALACVSCSLRKAARQTAVDPTSGEHVALFHPRHDLWHDHFRWQGARLFGRTATGRATVEALEMNRPLIIAIREEESTRGRHPAP